MATTIFVVSSCCMAEECQAIHYIKTFHDKFFDVKPNKDNCRPEKHYCGKRKLVSLTF